ncbi:MAG: mechanosensitive ion channel family protein [Conexivisphaerales archaeon]
MTQNHGSLFRYTTAIIITLIAIAIAVYFGIYAFKLIPVRFATLFEMVVAAIAGYLAVRIISSEIRKSAGRLIGERRAQNISVVFEYIAYIIVAIVVLSLAGVSGTELLAGGTFAGLVIGLAGQTVLSNILAGMMLIAARPLEVGDRVTITTWQYGLVFPSYPPKFFSDDKLIPGYTGVVTDIGLTYSVLTLDEGAIMKIPNNVLIQAAVIKQEVNERMVRVRFQAPSQLPLDTLLENVKQAVEKNEWVVEQKSARVYVQAIDTNYYLISAEALCKGQYEEPPRTSLYVDIWKAINEQRAKLSTA